MRSLVRIATSVAFRFDGAAGPSEVNVAARTSGAFQSQQREALLSRNVNETLCSPSRSLLLVPYLFGQAELPEKHCGGGRVLGRIFVNLFLLVMLKIRREANHIWLKSLFSVLLAF